MKWAKCNVGAEKETDAGLYFAWGETTGYTASQVGTDKQFSWSDYKYENGGKYNQSDGKTVLESEDDAARANMGGDWRMPTKAEFQELITYTNNEWIGDFDGNGTSGYKFTSKKDTSNYIFIPASERYKDFSTYIRDISYGVWSSSLYTSRPREAWTLDFNSSHIKAEDEYTCPYDRYYGMAVRGVL